MPARNLLKLLKRRIEKNKASVAKWLFAMRLHPKTESNHLQVLTTAQSQLESCDQFESESNYLGSKDPIIRQWHELGKKIKLAYQGKYVEKSDWRVLIQVPPAHASTAGYSLLNSLAESFSYIGIPSEVLRWGQDTAKTLSTFRPTVFLCSDFPEYVKNVDWDAVHAFRKRQKLLLGTTASLEAYGNTPLEGRIRWAKDNQVDFFYSYRDSSYVLNSTDYRSYHTAGLPILFLPFGANILHYYPVPDIERDLNFVLLASRKHRHLEFMKTVCHLEDGFIDGPGGWPHVKDFNFNRDRDRYIYARAQVGLNIHQPDQVSSPSELNERTYQLAACGVPQLMDHPKLLETLGLNELFNVADSPSDFTDLYISIKRDYDKALDKALRAQREILLNHTTFNRAEEFIRQLNSFFNTGPS